jgi:protein phosphatase
MPCHPSLLRAYLENIAAALNNEQDHQAEMLTQHAMELLAPVVPSPYSFGIALDTGVVRKGHPNEDYAFAYSFSVEGVPVGLFVVADGMGGHANGANASRLAVHTLVDTLLPGLLEGTILDLREALREAVQTANLVISNENALAFSVRDKMGTTITAVVNQGYQWYVANVGDSRTYLLHQEELIQITRDHSIVAYLVETGDLQPEDVYSHPQRNQIYRSLGESPEVEVDIFPFSIQDGDILLLCSDGLWEMIPNTEQIALVLQSRALDAAGRANHLIQIANMAGGHDNISVIVVDRAPIYDLPTLCIPLLGEKRDSSL